MGAKRAGKRSGKKKGRGGSDGGEKHQRQTEHVDSLSYVEKVYVCLCETGGGRQRERETKSKCRSERFPKRKHF